MNTITPEQEGNRTPAGTIFEPSRRSFLVASLTTGLHALCGPAVAQNAVDLRSLGSVLDTLLPADDLSPAPSSLGIDRDIQELVMTNPLLERLFGAALGWMDGLADQPFRDLSDAQRIEVLSFMETADFNQIPGRFFHIVRAFACEFYYARAETIEGFPLSPAPQPAGYPPPWS